MFRFIHTADVHLDSPLRSLALKNEDAAKVIANATRKSFENTIDLCLAEEVDALLIAGDLYDGDLKSMKTAAFFYKQMLRLTSNDIKVFIVRGNHDAESRVTRELQLPKGVHVFSAKGDTVTIEDKHVALHGVSFKDKHAPESLLPKYPAAKKGYVNIGLMHTSIDGSPEHDVYAPCSQQDLLGHGYDYWALGHIHKRDVYSNEKCTIVMPGIPQGRHINEDGARSVTLVSVGDDGNVTLQEHDTSLAQFKRLDIDLSGAEEWSELVERAEHAFKALFETISSKNIIVRVELSGTTSLAAELRRDGDRLFEQLSVLADSAGAIFIEKCNVACSVNLIETKAAGANPVAELKHLMSQRDDQSSRIKDQLKDNLKTLRGKLPAKIRSNFDESDDALIEEYMSEGTENILSFLVASQGEN